MYSMLYDAASSSAISTLSLHDALPISEARAFARTLGREERLVDPLQSLGAHPITVVGDRQPRVLAALQPGAALDRKSTRLNSSHPSISYAVFCLKKKRRAFLFVGFGKG